jgi:hypothetical protein
LFGLAAPLWGPFKFEWLGFLSQGFGGAQELHFLPADGEPVDLSPMIDQAINGAEICFFVCTLCAELTAAFRSDALLGRAIRTSSSNALLFLATPGAR